MSKKSKTMLFNVVITRSQVQTQTFTVESTNQSDLKKKLDELDFGFIDSHFDEGEVDSIDYEVKSVTKVKKGSPNMITFDDSDEDFQEMLDEDEDDYENEEVWEDIEEED